MKTLPLILVLLTLAPVQPSQAHGRHRGCLLNSSCCDSPARWAARHDPGDARLAIDTREGEATLLLTGDVVAVQLSDRTLHKVERKFRDERAEDDDNPLAAAIKTAVYTGVLSLLDHSAECRIRDIRDVDYRNGRLEFTTEGGRPLFSHMEVDDEDMLASFSERDAQAFVREFRKVKAAAR